MATSKKKSPKPPFPNMQGTWVARREFTGKRGFGHFKCTRCRKKWVSAYAFTNYTQGCKKCEVHTLPMWMWENASDHERSRETRPTKPHDSRRCAACAAGVCAASSPEWAQA